MDAMLDLTTQMRDLKNIYDEVFDGREYDDIPKKELWTYLEDILQLYSRTVAIVRDHDDRIERIERLIKFQEINELLEGKMDVEQPDPEVYS